MAEVTDSTAVPDLSGFSEDEIRKLMELGLIPEDLASVNSEISRQQGIIDSAGPEGRSNGRVYTAASPLEFAVDAWKKIRAQNALDKGVDGKKPLEFQRNNLLERMIQARTMAGQRVQGLDAPMGGGAPPMGLSNDPQQGAQAPPGAPPPPGMAPTPPGVKNLPPVGTMTPGNGATMSPIEARARWLRNLLMGSSKSGSAM